MKDEKEKLEKVRIESLNHIRAILPSIKSVEEELRKLQKEHKDYKEQYENVDRALAEIDGRLSMVPIGTRARKPMKLTLDQIKNIAKKLGVKL